MSNDNTLNEVGTSITPAGGAGKTPNTTVMPEGGINGGIEDLGSSNNLWVMDPLIRLLNGETDIDGFKAELNAAKRLQMSKVVSTVAAKGGNTAQLLTNLRGVSDSASRLLNGVVLIANQERSVGEQRELQPQYQNEEDVDGEVNDREVTDASKDLSGVDIFMQHISDTLHSVEGAIRQVANGAVSEATTLLSDALHNHAVKMLASAGATGLLASQGGVTFRVGNVDNVLKPEVVRDINTRGISSVLGSRPGFMYVYKKPGADWLPMTNSSFVSNGHMITMMPVSEYGLKGGMMKGPGNDNSLDHPKKPKMERRKKLDGVLDKAIADVRVETEKAKAEIDAARAIQLESKRALRLAEAKENLSHMQERARINGGLSGVDTRKINDLKKQIRELQDMQVVYNEEVDSGMRVAYIRGREYQPIVVEPDQKVLEVAQVIKFWTEGVEIKDSTGVVMTNVDTFATTQSPYTMDQVMTMEKNTSTAATSNRRAKMIVSKTTNRRAKIQNGIIRSSAPKLDGGVGGYGDPQEPSWQCCDDSLKLLKTDVPRTGVGPNLPDNLSSEADFVCWLSMTERNISELRDGTPTERCIFNHYPMIIEMCVSESSHAVASLMSSTTPSIKPLCSLTHLFMPADYRDWVDDQRSMYGDYLHRTGIDDIWTRPKLKFKMGGGTFWMFEFGDIHFNLKDAIAWMLASQGMNAVLDNRDTLSELEVNTYKNGALVAHNTADYAINPYWDLVTIDLKGSAIGKLLGGSEGGKSADEIKDMLKAESAVVPAEPGIPVGAKADPGKADAFFDRVQVMLTKIENQAEQQVASIPLNAETARLIINKFYTTLTIGSTASAPLLGSQVRAWPTLTTRETLWASTASHIPVVDQYALQYHEPNRKLTGVINPNFKVLQELNEDDKVTSSSYVNALRPTGWSLSDWRSLFLLMEQRGFAEAWDSDHVALFNVFRTLQAWMAINTTGMWSGQGTAKLDSRRPITWSAATAADPIRIMYMTAEHLVAAVSNPDVAINPLDIAPEQVTWNQLYKDASKHVILVPMDSTYANRTLAERTWLTELSMKPDRLILGSVWMNVIVGPTAANGDGVSHADNQEYTYLDYPETFLTDTYIVYVDYTGVAGGFFPSLYGTAAVAQSFSAVVLPGAPSIPTTPDGQWLERAASYFRWSHELVKRMRNLAMLIGYKVLPDGGAQEARLSGMAAGGVPTTTAATWYGTDRAQTPSNTVPINISETVNDCVFDFAGNNLRYYRENNVYVFEKPDPIGLIFNQMRVTSSADGIPNDITIRENVKQMPVLFGGLLFVQQFINEHKGRGYSPVIAYFNDVDYDQVASLQRLQARQSYKILDMIGGLPCQTVKAMNYPQPRQVNEMDALTPVTGGFLDRLSKASLAKYFGFEYKLESWQALGTVGYLAVSDLKVKAEMMYTDIFGKKWTSLDGPSVEMDKLLSVLYEVEQRDQQWTANWTLLPVMPTLFGFWVGPIANIDHSIKYPNYSTNICMSMLSYARHERVERVQPPAVMFLDCNKRQLPLWGMGVDMYKGNLGADLVYFPLSVLNAVNSRNILGFIDREWEVTSTDNPNQEIVPLGDFIL